MPSRRSLLLAGAGAAMTSRDLWAQPAWPRNSIKLIVPFAPGGGNDAFGRIVAKQMQDTLKTPVYVENKPGANGALGLATLKTSVPDGHTIATSTTGPLDVNPWLMRGLQYDPARDFTYVANLVKFPFFLCVSPQLKVNSVQELIARAKKGPPLTYSSAGSGNSTHLAGEVLASMTGTTMQHVPYKGTGPAMVALIGGEVDFTFGSGPSALAFVKAGKVLNLGVSDAHRISDMPEVLTIAEQGVAGYDVTSYGGIMAPARLATDAAAKLGSAFREMMDEGQFQKLLREQAMIANFIAGKEFETYVARERARWGEIVVKLNIQV